MGDLSRFDKWGFYDGDGLSPMDHERIEELKQKYAEPVSTYLASVSTNHPKPKVDI